MEMKRLRLAPLLLCTSLFGQEPDMARRVTELLASPKVIDKAWGAFWAGRLHTEPLNDLLIRELAAENLSDGDVSDGEQGAYLLTLFDALIESGVTVPVEVLLPFKDLHRDEVLILLARHPDNGAALLAMLEEGMSDPQWLTINNLLLQSRSERFLRRTLSDLNITHQFLLADQEGVGQGGGSGGGAYDGTRQLLKGFPPIGVYQLTEGENPNSVLVSLGPRKTYYRRAVVPTDQQIGWAIPTRVTDRRLERIEYLAALARVPVAEAKDAFAPTSTIVWQGPDALAQRVASQLDMQIAAIERFASLSALRDITNLAGTRLQISSEILDVRAGQSPPPAAIPPRQFILQ
jgi:hypothetical protein